MTSRSNTAGLPDLGNKAAVLLFIVTLIAGVAETQLAQYVQTSLGYRQPFFLFYVVHSSFAVIFPLHLLYILVTTQYTISALWTGIYTTISTHLLPKTSSFNQHDFPTAKLCILVAYLTTGVTLPALLWFAAVSRASLTDITAIWNTNAFFAYLLTVKVFKLHWESRKLGAVLLATAGVLAVVYGGTTTEEDGASSKAVDSNSSPGPTAPAVGILLTLAASVLVALYQVLYKKYAALPFDPEFEPALSDGYAHLTPAESLEAALHDPRDPGVDEAMGVYPPPFGLFSNMLTSTIGMTTFGVLWVFIPILHWLGLESFRAPPDSTTALGILGIALTGVIFNAGWMVLLGLWGPIIVSVGNLLQIILVPASDLIFGGTAAVITPWSLAGSGVIVAAFCMLVYDMLQPA